MYRLCVGGCMWILSGQRDGLCQWQSYCVPDPFCTLLCAWAKTHFCSVSWWALSLGHERETARLEGKGLALPYVLLAPVNSVPPCSPQCYQWFVPIAAGSSWQFSQCPQNQPSHVSLSVLSWEVSIQPHRDTPPRLETWMPATWCPLLSSMSFTCLGSLLSTSMF